MKISVSSRAQDDLDAIDRSLQLIFTKHIEKISSMPPRAHLKHGLPWFKEDVTKQARLVYSEDGDTLIVVRCFATHKEYERWYQGYR